MLLTKPATTSATPALRLVDLRLGPAWEAWLCARFAGFTLSEVVRELIARGLWHELARRLAEAELTGDARGASRLLARHRRVRSSATLGDPLAKSHPRRQARRRASDLRSAVVPEASIQLGRGAATWLRDRVREDGSLAATLRSLVLEVLLVELLTEDYAAEAALRHALLRAGRSRAQVRRAALAWRRGQRVAGVALGAPLAARLLDRGLFLRIRQLKRRHRSRPSRDPR